MENNEIKRMSIKAIGVKKDKYGNIISTFDKGKSEIIIKKDENDKVSIYENGKIIRKQG